MNAIDNTRTGKIARLPFDIRSQLNRRLADGEGGQQLVAWLNGLPTVRERLAEYYDGRPITEQNLSDWKRGGFADWQRHQETRALVQEFLHEAEEVGDEIGESGLADRATGMVTFVLLRLFREAATAESGPEQRKAVLEIARELSRLRRGDHQRQRVQLLTERHRAATQATEEERQEEEETKRESHITKVRVFGQGYYAEYVQGLAKGTLTPARAAMIEDFFDHHSEDLEEAGVRPLPKDPRMQTVGRRPAKEKSGSRGAKSSVIVPNRA